MVTLNQVCEGMKILSQYMPEGMDSFMICADHDVIMVGHDIKESITNDDEKKLEALGWRWSNECGSYAIYV